MELHDRSINRAVSPNQRIATSLKAGGALTYGLPDQLLARGEHWITSVEITEVLGVSDVKARQIASRWRSRQQAFSPTRKPLRAHPSRRPRSTMLLINNLRSFR